MIFLVDQKDSAAYHDLHSPQSLRDLLKGILTDKEQSHLMRSYELLGSLAIIEVPKELKKKERKIASLLMESHKNIKTVVKKRGGHEGELRLQKYSYIAGKRTKEVEYKEHNCTFHFDIEKSYFSSRLGNERKRIITQVKPNEVILVMFSGSGPYPITIAKNTKARSVYGIELNKYAHKYAFENVIRNKLKNVFLYQGDARKVAPRLKMSFDRLLMPLPKGAEGFLPTALAVMKRGGIIHMYDFEKDSEFDKGIEKVRQACRKAGKKCKILSVARCGQSSPHVFRICIDFRVS